jgi:catechol 2,3-dioxygenase-like lactoylglutathione lyase family enzyme
MAARLEHSVAITGVDHIGIRVSDTQRALAFYGALGFDLVLKVEYDAVAILRNAHGVELNLILNANDLNGGRNILMDAPVKYPGYTHVALRVASVAQAMNALARHGIPISQGPVSFGADGHVSVFVRDPDRNVVELRGRAEDPAALGAAPYEP